MKSAQRGYKAEDSEERAAERRAAHRSPGREADRCSRDIKRHRADLRFQLHEEVGVAEQGVLQGLPAAGA